MDYGLTPEEEAFRGQVRQFLKDNPPEQFEIEGEDDGFGSGAHSRAFVKAVARAGWLTRSWPVAFGGQGRPMMEFIIMISEFAYARAPFFSYLFADSLAHNIMQYGSDLLKKEFLPKLGSGDLVAWMGLSEPEAGSDLLAVKTKANKDGDCYVINGQKVWSSHAHLADFGYFLVRTNPSASRSQGLSMILLDMKWPGVTVRPLINLLGAHYHNEVFLDEVHVPQDYLIGKENEGFRLMLSSLETDRFWARVVKPPWCRRLLDDLVDYVKTARRDGRVLGQDRVIRRKLAAAATEIEACEAMFFQMSRMVDRGDPLTFEGSVGKLYADEVGQRLVQLAMQILGPYGQLDEGSEHAWLRGSVGRWDSWSLGWTLAGGTSELQRNTIATMGLKLPRG